MHDDTTETVLAIRSHGPRAVLYAECKLSCLADAMLKKNNDGAAFRALQLLAALRKQ